MFVLMYTSGRPKLPRTDKRNNRVCESVCERERDHYTRGTTVCLLYTSVPQNENAERISKRALSDGFETRTPPHCCLLLN